MTPRSILPSTLELPEALTEACASGDCVLYAGAGLSARVGFPTYQTFLEELLEWAKAKKLLAVQAASTYSAGIQHNDLGSAADGIVSDLHSHGNLLHQHLKETFLRTASLSDVHKILGRLPFAAGLTTNFDTLIE